MGLSPHRRQLFFDPLFYVGPFRRGQLHRADELVGVELLRRRDVLDPHIGLDRLPRDLGKLRIDGALKFLEAFDMQIDGLFRVEVSEFESLHEAVDERLAWR